MIAGFFEISLPLVSPEYPDTPSSLGPLLQLRDGPGRPYDPELPPLRPTVDLPRAAAALEMRARFLLGVPLALRRSLVHSFSFLIDELGHGGPSSGFSAD